MRTRLQPILIAIVLSLPGALGAAGSVPLAPAAPPSPAVFAPPAIPLPFAGQSSSAHLRALLRRFRPIQEAEVLLRSEPGQPPALQVVLTPKTGASLEGQMLQTLRELLLDAVPGLTPAQLNVADSNGVLLIAHGEVQSPPASATPPQWWLIAPVMVIAVGIAAILRRKPAIAPARDDLATVSAEALAASLRGETATLAAAALTLLPPAQARRVSGILRRRGQRLPASAGGLDPAVQRALRRAWLERLEIQGGRG